MSITHLHMRRYRLPEVRKEFCSRLSANFVRAKNDTSILIWNSAKIVLSLYIHFLHVSISFLKLTTIGFSIIFLNVVGYEHI